MQTKREENLSSFFSRSRSMHRQKLLSKSSSNSSSMSTLFVASFLALINMKASKRLYSMFVAMGKLQLGNLWSEKKKMFFVLASYSKILKHWTEYLRFLPQLPLKESVSGKALESRMSFCSQFCTLNPVQLLRDTKNWWKATTWKETERKHQMRYHWPSRMVSQSTGFQPSAFWFEWFYLYF